MPPTSLTKVTASGFGDGVADVGYESADQTNSNDFVNTGKTIILVDNASGGNVTPSFPIGPNSRTVNDAITKTPNTPVAAGKVGFYGPFPTAIYGDTVQVDWDTDTSITVAVVEQEPTAI